jgi:general secretion pathway protein I
MRHPRPSLRVPPPRQRGFSLVELIAAFVIFALAFGMLMQILSGSLRNTRQSADYTQAALWAQSLLDIQGVGETLRDRDDGGNFDDKYSWRLHVAKIQPPEPLQSVGGGGVGNQNGQAPVVTPVANNIDLYQLELVVSWGSYYMTHNARFVTLRAVTPDNGQPPGGAFLPVSTPRQGAKQ